MNAFAVYAELGVGNARTEIAKLGEQGAGLAFAGFQGADGGTVDGARVAVVFAHPLRGAGEVPVLGQGILRVEGEQVVVAAALYVQIAAQAGQEVIGLAQFGTGLGGAIAQLTEPADQLVVAQTAGRVLDVRLEMVERAGVLGMAVARELRQIAYQGVAIGVDEARQAVGQPGVERAVAREKALIEQADVEFRVGVVHLRRIRPACAPNGSCAGRRPTDAAGMRRWPPWRPRSAGPRGTAEAGRCRSTERAAACRSRPPRARQRWTRRPGNSRRSRRIHHQRGRLRRYVRQAPSARRPSPGIAGECATHCCQMADSPRSSFRIRMASCTS